MADRVEKKSYTLRIPRWHPARLNTLLGHWAARARRKRQDRELVATYARLARIPRAEGRRRVSLRITTAKGHRAADPGAYWKSLLDALVACGLLIDDSHQWVELAPDEYDFGAEHSTDHLPRRY